MRITRVTATPLRVPYARPYHWAHGVVDSARVVLVRVETDAGHVGHGESIGTPAPAAIVALIEEAARDLVGADPFHVTRLIAAASQRMFRSEGSGSGPRFAGQVLAGIEMALWDVAGRSVGRPVHELLGGAVRDDVAYFGFAQGGDATEVAADARRLHREGYEVLYIKLGRGDVLDLETVAAVRGAVGDGVRLRVDPNESWSLSHAARMIALLARHGVEMVEQPTIAQSLSALSQVKAASPIAISADQAVFTAFEVHEIARRGAADLVVLGLHETGGLGRFLKAAHVAEAAGIDVCLHGLYETGITLFASQQVAAVIPNLDDANQIMTPFLAWDIVRASPRPGRGRLPIPSGPGLGFELDPAAVAEAARFARPAAE